MSIQLTWEAITAVLAILGAGAAAQLWFIRSVVRQEVADIKADLDDRYVLRREYYRDRDESGPHRVPAGD